MSRELLEKLEELEKKATPGPWTMEFDYNICHGYHQEGSKHVATWIANVDYENRPDLTTEGYSDEAQADSDLIITLRNEAIAALRQSVEECERKDAEIGLLRGRIVQTALDADARVTHPYGNGCPKCRIASPPAPTRIVDSTQVEAFGEAKIPREDTD